MGPRGLDEALRHAGEGDLPDPVRGRRRDRGGRRRDPPRAKAREGFFPGDIEADVSEARLKRFFEKEEGGYSVRKEVRELVVFAPHNLLSDPPFSNLDLVVCRNVLIYLQQDVQKEVVELFHYALKPDGLLSLGSSETIAASDLFRTENKDLRLYRRRDVPAPEPRLPVFPLTRARMLEEGEGKDVAVELPHYGQLHQRMVEQYAPPSMLVGPEGRVVHLSEHAGRYLVHPGGELTTSAFKLVREELRIELRAALHAARERGVPLEADAARDIAERRQERHRRAELAEQARPKTLEDLTAEVEAGEKAYH